MHCNLWPEHAETQCDVHALWAIYLNQRTKKKMSLIAEQWIDNIVQWANWKVIVYFENEMVSLNILNQYEETRWTCWVNEMISYQIGMCACVYQNEMVCSNQFALFTSESRKWCHIIWVGIYWMAYKNKAATSLTTSIPRQNIGQRKSGPSECCVWQLNIQNNSIALGNVKVRA